MKSFSNPFNPSNSLGGNKAVSTIIVNEHRFVFSSADCSTTKYFKKFKETVIASLVSTPGCHCEAASDIVASDWESAASIKTSSTAEVVSSTDATFWCTLVPSAAALTNTSTLYTFLCLLELETRMRQVMFIKKAGVPNKIALVDQLIEIHWRILGSGDVVRIASF